MLKAKPIPALVIKLGEGEVAVFLKQGTRWNGLTEHLCISPANLAGGMMVTAEKGSGHHFTDIFATITGADPEPVQVVMASSQIEKALRDAEADFAAKDQAKEAAEPQKAGA